MNPVKRLGVAAVLVALGAILAASPVLAGKVVGFVQSTTFKLAPPIDAPEPEASGTCTIDAYVGGPEDVTVSCKRLTPGKQYTVVVLVEWQSWEYSWIYWGIWDSGFYLEEHAVTADGKGRLDAQFTVESDESRNSRTGESSGTDRHVADLWIENAAGQVVLAEP